MMLKKTCPNCKTISYGSSNTPWICPKCKKDISNVPSKNADTDKMDFDEFIRKCVIHEVFV